MNLNKHQIILAFAVLLILLGGSIAALGFFQKNGSELKPSRFAANQQNNNGNAGCACCGNVNTAFVGTRGKAVLKDGFQEATITVNGGYNPQTIELKSNVPAVLNFSKGTSYCDSTLVFLFLGKSYDISRSGAKVEIPPLKPGIYEYTCGMNMLRGYIEVK